MFNKSFAVAKYTLKENISNKIFNGFILFALIILGGILILKELTLYESLKVIKDVGVFLIEFFLLLITVYLSSTIIIKAHKEKSIYLILTKSISRTQYIVGVSLGIYSILAMYLFFLSGVLSIVLLKEGFVFSGDYFLTLLNIYYKLIILSSLGVLFSIISDSYVTGNIFTFCIYIISHMSFELKLMARKVSGTAVKYLLNLLHLILPKYYLLNRKDYLAEVNVSDLKVFIYVVLYVSIILLLNSFIFEKRKL